MQSMPIKWLTYGELQQLTKQGVRYITVAIPLPSTKATPKFGVKIVE